VRRLVRSVPQSKLSLKNVGPSFWDKVKDDPGFHPEFRFLEKADLWSKPEEFKETVWPWLCGEVQDWSVETVSRLDRAGGTAHSVEIRLGEQTEKVLWGDLKAILDSRGLTDVVLIEVSHAGRDPLSDDILLGALGKLSSQKNGVKVVIWGSVEAVARMQETSVKRLLTAPSPMQAYRVRQLTVYMPKEPSMGGGATGVQSVSRTCLILSPGPLRPSQPYIVSHIGWTPAIMTFCVGLMDTPTVQIGSQSRPFSRVSNCTPTRRAITTWGGVDQTILE
jgi:hypothetical protein